MAYKCSNCHESGHTVRTCPKSKLPAKASAAAPVESGSVLAQLEARRARLQKELAIVERLLPELRALEELGA